MEGIILYTKMLGKANIHMEERVKLPVYHYGAFRAIFREYLKDYILSDTITSTSLK
jgi:hypothetical protein